MQGQRALLVEVQALTARTAPETPSRRSAQGVDGGRLALLLAVLEQRAGVALVRTDVFASTVGGIRVLEPAADLALAVALASAVTGRPLPPDLVVFGEVGLGGEIRQVPHAPRRLAEAARVGFRHALVPASCPDGPPGMEVVHVRSLAQAVGAGHGVRQLALSARPAVCTPLCSHVTPIARRPTGRRWGACAAACGVAAQGAGYHAGVVVRPSSAMADALALVAPGQPLRDGIERVLQANRGLLLVVGDGPDVLSICTGGFLLDAEFSPQRLSELAKMDGAVILSPDADRIARANVHLMPNATIPTIETGTRHRTAERVARSIDVPVVSVSAAMGLVTVYRRDTRHVLQDERRLHERVRQALQTTRRFRQRFDATLSSLSALEIADTVTVRDVAAVLQPAGLLIRIAEEVKVDLVELGDDGRLLRLQLEEVLDGVDPVRRLVVHDYLHRDDDGRRPAHDGARPPARAPARAPTTRSDGHARGRGTASPSASPITPSTPCRPVHRRPARRAARVGGPRAGRSRRARSSPRLPPLAPPAPVPRGPRGQDRRPLRRAAADHAHVGGRARRGRRRRRGPRPVGEGRAGPSGRSEHPRPLQLNPAQSGRRRLGVGTRGALG